MSEWKEYKIKQLGKIVTGKTPSTKDITLYGGHIPFICIPDLEKSKRVFVTNKSISNKGASTLKNLLIPPNSLVVSCIATIGKVGITSCTSLTNQQINSIIPDSSIVNTDFLYYLLKNQGEKIGIYGGGGSVFNIISKSKFSEIPLKIPDLPTQTAIAEILSSLDDKIELNNKINQELETLAQTLFKQWFIDFEFPNENGEPYKSFGGEMVDSKLSEIPEGWEVSEIGLVAKLGAGGDKPKKVSNTPTEELSIPIYSNGITDDGLYGYTNEAKIFEESITISARGTIGFICLRTTPYVPIVRLISVIAVENYVSTKFLYMWLKNQLIVGNGTTQQQLTVPDFRGSKIIIPAKSLVNEFTNQMDLIIDNINFNKKENKELIVLRDTLLPKLISGELEINEINN
jgi:type I restriction enzyme S subunit